MDKSKFHLGMGPEVNRLVYMSLERRNYDPALMCGAGQSVTSTDITDGEIVNADISASAAIALSKLAALTATYIIVGNGSNVPTAVAMSGDATLSNAGALTIAANAVTAAKTVDAAGVGGLFVKKTAIAVYDFAADGGAAGAIVLADAATIPDNSVITGFNYDVITTCTTAGADAGTMVLSLPTDGAFSTAVAVSDGSNPLDAGFHFGSTLTPLVKKTTAARKIGVTIATQDFTAGKVVFFVDYIVSQ